MVTTVSNISLRHGTVQVNNQYGQIATLDYAWCNSSAEMTYNIKEAMNKHLVNGS